MQIFIGADHNGFRLKQTVASWLRQAGYDVIDEGDDHLQSDDDFPQFAARVVLGMKASTDNDARGILICGSGQGMCMAANRFPGIRASLCWDIVEAQMSRNDDDANILCLPGRIVSTGKAEAIITHWLATPFAGATRFKRRIKELDDLL